MTGGRGLDLEDRVASLTQTLSVRAAAFDRLGAMVAVLDGSGLILDTNDSWRLFARLNDGSPSTTGTMVNYLEVCDRAAANGSSMASIVATGLREVLAGERDHASRRWRVGGAHAHGDGRAVSGRFARAAQIHLCWVRIQYGSVHHRVAPQRGGCRDVRRQAPPHPERCAAADDGARAGRDMKAAVPPDTADEECEIDSRVAVLASRCCRRAAGRLGALLSTV